MAAMERILANRNFFSDVSKYAVMSRRVPPVLTEPYVINMMEKTGMFDPAPLAARLRSGEFEVVLTSINRDGYRGLELLSPGLRRAIGEAYVPLCWMADVVVNRRKMGADAALSSELLSADCSATTIQGH